MEVTTFSHGILPTQSVTVTLVAQWERFIDAAPRTIETYTKNTRQFMLYLHQEGIDRPTRQTVLDFKRKLEADGKSAATRKAYITALRLFFSWTEQAGIYPNIAEHVKGAKVSAQHQDGYLSAQQAAHLLSTIDRETLAGRRDYALIALLLTTGLRTIEVSRANVGDLQALGNFTALYFQGKGRQDKGEYKKIEAPVEAAIRAYIAARGKIDKTSPLFASDAHRNAGGRLTTRSISRIIKGRLRAAGYDNDRLTAHSTRHTAAMILLNNGGDVLAVKQLLGHSSISTTMIYLEEKKQSESRSEKAITSAIFGAA